MARRRLLRRFDRQLMPHRAERDVKARVGEITELEHDSAKRVPALARTENAIRRHATTRGAIERCARRR